MTKRKPSKARYVATLTQECLDAGVSLKAAMGRSRRRLHCIPRHKAWKRLIVEGYSLPGIAKAAGTYDHTTILSGSRQAGRYDDWLKKRQAKEAAFTAQLTAKLEARGIPSGLIPCVGGMDVRAWGRE